MSRKLLGALLVFAVLLGAAYYILARPEKGERRGARPRPVALLKGDQIQSVTIAARGNTAQLRRQGQAWRLVRPAQDDADRAAVKTMLEKLTTLEFGDMVTQRRDRQAQHGVDDKTGIHVTVSDGKSTLAEFYLGKVVDGFTMFRAAGSNQVYQAVGTLDYVFHRESKNWRDRAVVALKADDVRGLTVTTAGMPEAGSIVLARPDATKAWRVERSSRPVSSLDNRVVSGLLSSLANLAAFDFADGAGPTQTGLNIPAATVTARLQDASQVELRVGRNKGDDFWVQRLGDPQVYVVKRYALDNLIRRPLDFSTKKVLELKPDQIVALTLNKLQEKSRITLTRGSDGWLGGGKKVADGSKIEAALQTLSTLTAEGFARHEAAAMGMDPAGWQVELKLKDGTTHRLVVGSVERDGLFGLTRDGQPEIFTFRKYTLDRFLLDPGAYR